MISFRNRWIFVHLPKTAGSAIERALMGHTEDRHLDPGHPDTSDIYSELDNRFTKHSGIYTFIDAGIDLAEYFVFTVIRNPWDRAVSTMVSPHWWAGGVPNPTLREAIGRCVTADQMLCHEDEPLDAHFDMVLRYEHLQRDFDTLCKRIGVPATELPEVLPGIHMHYRRYYYAETEAMVSERFAKEIAFGNYRLGD